MKTEKKTETSKRGRIAFRVLMIALISIFFGGAVYSINARRIVGNAMPMPFGVGLSVILSGSMEPTLSVNDLVVVKAADSYTVDDIVVYQSGSTLVIHRIVDIQGDVYITKGDANNTADEPIGLAVIKGKEVFSVPFVGLIVRLLQTTLGKLVVIALAAFLLARSWRKERTEGDEELDRIKKEIRRLKALEEASLPESEPAPSPASEGPDAQSGEKQN
jgi:signal peptidase